MGIKPRYYHLHGMKYKIEMPGSYSKIGIDRYLVEYHLGITSKDWDWGWDRPAYTIFSFRDVEPAFLFWILWA